MKLGILITSISNFGKKGFYNAQEIGLAKALAKLVDGVTVYKLVSSDQEEKTEKINTSGNAKIIFIPAKNFGINGFIRTDKLNKSIDALIHFSDTQFSVPKVYKWCTKNNVRYLPYIGVTESHSTSALKKIITNILFQRNLNIYRKLTCCVKTPAVKKTLAGLGVHSTVVIPVGLDLDILHREYTWQSKEEISRKYGYSANEKVLLFIGRMIDEKKPVEMIEILAALREKDDSYKLIMVGTGELEVAVQKIIKDNGLEQDVQLIREIPNRDIWELYRIAEAFVNLNQQEIFGMAILEAMYYESKVIAWHAPGPDFIIESGKSGFLVNSKEEAIDRIINSNISKNAAHDRIMENFTWDIMAAAVVDMLKVGANNG